MPSYVQLGEVRTYYEEDGNGSRWFYCILRAPIHAPGSRAAVLHSETSVME